MKLFLTGASGFIGAATLRLALEAGFDVVAPLRPGAPAPRLDDLRGRFARIDLDLCEQAAVAEALARHRPDLVIHLAWWGVGNALRNAPEQVSANIAAACALAEGAVAAGCGVFIGAGSQAEYGPGSSMREDAPADPATLYGAAKLASFHLTRQIVRAAGVRHAWVRIFSTYGPGDNPGWLIPHLMSEFRAGRCPKLTEGTQLWDWLHVEDAARAILAIAQTPQAEGIFNLGSGAPCRVRDVVESLRDLVAPGLPLVFGEIPMRADQTRHLSADISRITSLTGWRPQIALADGLRMTAAAPRNGAGHD